MWLFPLFSTQWHFNLIHVSIEGLLQLYFLYYFLYQLGFYVIAKIPFGMGGIYKDAQD